MITQDVTAWKIEPSILDVNGGEAMRNRRLSVRRLRNSVQQIVSSTTIACLIVLAACSTQPSEPATYYRTAQTELTMDSTPSGTANVDNKYVGVTPVTYPLQYEQEVERSTRNVTFWQTQPGLSVFLTVVSLGLYLPFSMIPSDTETTQVPLENYRSNQFLVTIDAPGYEQWKQAVVAKGEMTLHLQAQLVKKAEH